MSGYQNFQVNRNKNSNLNVYEKKKNVNKAVENMSKDEKLRNGVKTWGSFYKENVHRFIEDYFEVELHTFQKIMIYLMSKNNFFMLIAARGMGKSFLVALYAMAICVLRPSLPVILASGTKGQAQLIITQKIDKELKLKYPNIAREIKSIKTGSSECSVILHNGSTIQAVTSTDSARGYRAGVLICDEFRIIKEDVLNRVLRPFLNYIRQPKFINRPEYSKQKKELLKKEETQEIYISSAYYKSNWSYSKFKSFVELMCKGKDYFAVAFPYQLSVHHGLLSEKRVEQMKLEPDMSEIIWAMEMDSLFYGLSENAFFNLEDLQKNRNMVKAFYPTSDVEFAENKNKRKKSLKMDGEIRLIGVDVAMMAGRANDSTIFTCMRLLPNGDSFVRQVQYIENMSGQHTEKQAIRLKQLYNDFEADYVVMDTNGNGISLFDDCSKILYDQDRDVEYPAWTAMNNEEMRNRALDKNAIPIIYSIKVVRQEINHEMAMGLKSDLEKKKIKLLVNEHEAKDHLNSKKTYLKLSPEEQADLLMPYVQTTVLINEMLNLEYEMRNGFVKLFEKRSSSKDRYSSLSYCNYYARILEAEMKRNGQADISDYMYFNQSGF